MALISCKDLSFAYDGIYALKNVNFEVNDNDYLCVIGENGAGKSTLLKGLLNLKKPANGSISFDKTLLKNEIGYLPQKTNIQKDFPASVQEVVLSGCLNRLGLKPFYTKKEKNIAEKNIELLGLANIKYKSFKDLSGGQQQRVLLARALCSTKKLLILDEPVTGLDPLVRNELYELITKINNELGIAIIMVSHDIEGSIKYAKKILHLNNNQLFFGSKQEYINSDIGKRFLGDKV